VANELDVVQLDCRQTASAVSAKKVYLHSNVCSEGKGKGTVSR